MKLNAALLVVSFVFILGLSLSSEVWALPSPEPGTALVEEDVSLVDLILPH